MTWNLFIDDERFPPNDGREWVICRNHFEVFECVFDLGMPSYISFDHDLGENLWSGYDIAKELVDIALTTIDPDYKFPADFDFYVHSQNPVGKANIEGLLNGYLKAIARANEVPVNEARMQELLDIAENDEEGDITVGRLYY